MPVKRKAKATELPIPDGRPLLALDPSSSACGYAIFWGGTLTRFGVLRGKAKAPALDRIDLIVDALEAIVASIAPCVAVMEISGGKTHGRLSKASGLSVLGHGQGEVRRALKSAGVEVLAVPENAWTASVPKPTRAKRVALEYPPYRAFAARGEDAGLDAADAIGIGLWYIGKLRERELIARARAQKGA